MIYQIGTYRIDAGTDPLTCEAIEYGIASANGDEAKLTLAIARMRAGNYNGIWINRKGRGAGTTVDRRDAYGFWLVSFRDGGGIETSVRGYYFDPREAARAVLSGKHTGSQLDSLKTAREYARSLTQKQDAEETAYEGYRPSDG